MDVQLLLSTSYAPGHNFWPGTPLSWWIRGTFAFLLVAGPLLAGSVAGVLLCRHRRTIPFAVAVIGVLSIVWFGWPAVMGLRLRDGDMPWYRGLVLGYQSRLWILLSATALCLLACVVPSRPLPEQRGFAVGLSQE